MWEITLRDARGQIAGQVTLEKGALSLGRNPDNDIVIPNPAMSRRHAVVELRDGKPWIIDQGSVNGVLVDGRRITAACPIDQASQIEISGWRMVLRHMEAPDPTRLIKLTPVEDAEASAAPEAAAAPDPAPAPVYSRETAQARTDEFAATEGTAAHLLEQKISSIRSHRASQSSARDEKRMAFEAEWAEVLDELRQVRARLRDEERVRYFTIGREGEMVALKVQRKSSQTSLLMTRGHPDRPVEGEMRVYVRDHVWPDKNFSSPRDALNELLSHIASLLA